MPLPCVYIHGCYSFRKAFGILQQTNWCSTENQGAFACKNLWLGAARHASRASLPVVVQSQEHQAIGAKGAD